MFSIKLFLFQLDSIKWYKDSQEFYRHMLRPELATKNMIFNSPGVKVGNSQSYSHQENDLQQSRSQGMEQTEL